MTQEPFIDERGHYFVPLREVAEALGCLVSFDPDGSWVTIQNTPFYHRFQMSGTDFLVDNIRMLVIDNRIWVHLAYFRNRMQLRAEVDPGGNVHIGLIMR
jgi:hypothetical protein